MHYVPNSRDCRSGSKRQAGVNPPDFPAAEEVEALPVLVDDLGGLLDPAPDAALLLVDVRCKPGLDAHTCRLLAPFRFYLRN